MTTHNMHGFLLTAVCHFFDQPMQFYGTKKEARAGIRRRHSHRTPDPVVAWKITEFRNGKAKANPEVVEAA